MQNKHNTTQDNIYLEDAFSFVYPQRVTLGDCSHNSQSHAGAFGIGRRTFEAFTAPEGKLNHYLLWLGIDQRGFWRGGRGEEGVSLLANGRPSRIHDTPGHKSPIARNSIIGQKALSRRTLCTYLNEREGVSCVP